MSDFRLPGHAMTLGDYYRAEADGRLPKPAIRRHATNTVIVPDKPKPGTGRKSGAAQRAQRKEQP